MNNDKNMLVINKLMFSDGGQNTKHSPTCNKPDDLLQNFSLKPFIG